MHPAHTVRGRRMPAARAVGVKVLHAGSLFRAHSTGTSTRSPPPSGPAPTPPTHTVFRGHGRIAAWSASSSAVRVRSCLLIEPSCIWGSPHCGVPCGCGGVYGDDAVSRPWRSGADEPLPLP